MTLDLHATAPPLEIDAAGVARVRGTRISLELLVEAFGDGATPEQIALRYPTLALPDVYAVLAYVLRHRDAIDAYMEARSAAEVTARAGLDSDITALRMRLVRGGSPRE